MSEADRSVSSFSSTVYANCLAGLSHMRATNGEQWWAPGHTDVEFDSAPDIRCACGEGYFVTEHSHYHDLRGVCHNMVKCK